MKSKVEDNNVEAQAENEMETEVTTGAPSQVTVEQELAARLVATEERLAYLAAEFENYKRQALRRENEARERTSRNVLEQMMPALDNFNLALQYAGTAKDVASLKTGLDFVGQQMESALRGAGLEPIPALNQPFDPTLHEAIEEVPSEGAVAGTIVAEAQKGYIYQGQVLRVSRVKVAK